MRQKTEKRVAYAIRAGGGEENRGLFRGLLPKEREMDMVLLKQMLIFFFIMALGFMMGKKNIMDEKSSRCISWLVVNIANPALILSGSMTAGDRLSGGELLLTAGIAVGMFAVLIFLACFLPGLFCVPEEGKGIYRIMFVFSNIGFMGFPILSAVYGKGALINATVYLLPFNLLIYTYGILCLQKGKEKVGGNLFRSVVNVGVLASVASLIIYLGRIPIPAPVSQAVDMLSGLTGPLSMLVIGASFAFIDLRELYRDVRLPVFVLLRLILIPILGICLVKAITENEVIIQVFRIIIATPAASMCVMMSKQYGGDDLLAARGVALSTLFSVVTLPLVVSVT